MEMARGDTEADVEGSAVVRRYLVVCRPGFWRFTHLDDFDALDFNKLIEKY